MKGFVLLSALSLSACSSMHVSSEKSPGADLGHYRTYSWKMLKADPSSENSIAHENLRSALDTALKANGFVQAAEGAPSDFFVKYSVASQMKAYADPGTYYGSPFDAAYMSMPPTIEFYREGSLVVDFVDARSGSAFWRGVADSVIGDRGDVPELAKKAAQQIVAEYREDEKEISESRTG